MSCFSTFQCVHECLHCYFIYFHKCFLHFYSTFLLQFLLILFVSQQTSFLYLFWSGQWLQTLSFVMYVYSNISTANGCTLKLVKSFLVLENECCCLRYCYTFPPHVIMVPTHVHYYTRTLTL